MHNEANAAKDARVFDEELAKRIDAVKERRNYYAHTFFKEQLFTKDMEDNPDTLLDVLAQDINELNSINTQLLEIDRKQREEAEKIKTK